MLLTAWRVSVFGVILVRIFPHSDWTRRDTQCLFIYKNLSLYKNLQTRIYLYKNIKTVMIKWQAATKRARTWTSLNFTKELRFSKKILGQNFGIFQLRHLLKIWKFKRSNKRLTLCKKYPYLELLWSGFSPNAGKYGPE